MKTTTEMEIKVSGGRIICAEVKGDVCKLVVEVEVKNPEMMPEVKKLETIPEVKNPGTMPEVKNPEDLFVLIEASKLMLRDKFMQHKPRNEREREFKARLEAVILQDVKDFYRPRIDPSFTDDGTGICYEAGKKPAVGKSYNWWCDVAEEYNPKRKSRIGTVSEYIAFLGVLIKTLVAEGWSVDEAWDAVCNDSKKLGHYINSKNAKFDFEPTGSREVCGFFDLANAWKILADDEGGVHFWLASAYYDCFSNDYPLADLSHRTYNSRDFFGGIGWIVLGW